MQARDVGLLVLRVGLGAMFIGHGLPKLLGGPDGWTRLGRTMEIFGIDQAHLFFGFMAAFSESVGGLCLVLGLAVRPAAGLLLCTMIVAAAKHITAGDGFGGSSHAVEDGIVFLALLFMGGGRYTLDRSRLSR